MEVRVLSGPDLFTSAHESLFHDALIPLKPHLHLGLLSSNDQGFAKIPAFGSALRMAGLAYVPSRNG